MSFLSRIINRTPPASVDEVTDQVALLLLAARDDKVLLQQLEKLLNLPQEQRGPIIETAVAEMKMRNEPGHLVAAFSLLATEHGAASASEAMRRLT